MSSRDSPPPIPDAVSHDSSAFEMSYKDLPSFNAADVQNALKNDETSILALVGRRALIRGGEMECLTTSERDALEQVREEYNLSWKLLFHTSAFS